LQQEGRNPTRSLAPASIRIQPESGDHAIRIASYLVATGNDRQLNDDGGAERKDGRKSLLVYMRPDVIKILKKSAIDLDRTAYSIVEEAVVEWIDRRAGTGSAIGYVDGYGENRGADGE
jgi:hypothetical protein